MNPAMKKVLSALLCVVAVLVVLCVGVVRGWSGERADVIDSLSAEGQLHALAQQRARDSYRLCVVAGRYLDASEEDLLALAQAAAPLLNGTGETIDVIALDNAVTDAALRLSERLTDMEAVQKSPRDTAYIGRLSASLSRQSSVSRTYQLLAEAFNTRLTTTAMGKLAKLLGTDLIDASQPVFQLTPFAAEPLYPAHSGVATDTAGVLSISLLNDLRELESRMGKAAVPQLYVATVDFLDGADAFGYAEALFTRWELEEDDMLLLIAVGEEAWAIHTGKGVNGLVSHASLEQLLTESFSVDFLAQRYDAAVVSFATALVTEINTACRTSVKTSDLFRNASASLFDNWASSAARSSSSADSPNQADGGVGMALIKTAVIVVLLVLIFGVLKRIRNAKRNPQDAPASASASPAEQRVYFKPRQPQPVKQYFPPRKPQE